MNTPTANTYWAALNAIDIIRIVASYAGDDLAKRPNDYNNMPVEYAIMRSKMWELFDSYQLLEDQDKVNSRIRQVFYSVANQYKRVTRSLMVSMCRALDKKTGQLLFTDMYQSLVELIERLYLSGDDKDVINAFGHRLLQFHDMVTDIEPPSAFYEFFGLEVLDLNDLYIGYVRGVAK